MKKIKLIHTSFFKNNVIKIFIILVFICIKFLTPKMRSSASKCFLNLALVWCETLSNPRVTDTHTLYRESVDPLTQEKHVCMNNFDNKVFLPRLSRFESLIGEIKFSSEGKLLNMDEIAKKLSSLGEIKPVARDDAVLPTVDGLIGCFTTSVSHPHELSPEQKDSITLRFKRGVERLRHTFESAFETFESDETWMPQTRTQIEEIISVLKKLNIVSGSKTREVFEEIMVSVFRDMCSSYQFLTEFNSHQQIPDLENPHIRKLIEATSDLMSTLLSDKEDNSVEDVAKKVFVYKEAIDEIACNDAIMDIYGNCTNPRCDGDYNALSKEHMELVFSLRKRGKVLISLTELILEYLKKHIDPNYMPSEEAMACISKKVCTELLFLAVPHENSEMIQ